jgi:tetratricopeptide (TPR) repeat protein
MDEAIHSDPGFKEVYSIRGSYYESIGLFEKALHDFENYIRFDQGNEIVWQNMGFLLRRLGRNKDAVTSFQRAMKINPNNAWTCTNLAETFYEMERYQDAVVFYQEAIKINPSEPSNYGNLGWTYYMLNNDQKCIEYSLKAVAHDPHAYYARFNIALANLRAGFYEEARKLYGDLLKEEALPAADRIGAISDIMDLKMKGIRTNEASAILKDLFSK